MRVVFYTRTSLLDTALSLVQALSREVELYVLLELTPESWRTSAFDVEPADLQAGVIDGRVFADAIAPQLSAYLRGVADFKLVVHRTRSVHPATWRTSQAAVQFIQSVRPDVVHFDDASLRLGLSVSQLQSVPVVFSVHDPLPHTGEDDWRTRLAYRLTLRKATRFILHSHVLKDAFCARFGLSKDCVDVVHLAAYALYRDLGLQPTESARPAVLFFGRLSPYKGLEVFYEAAPLVAEAVPEVRFVVAGRPIPGYTPPPSPRLPHNGEIKHLHQYISNNHLAKLFGRAWLVTCPYIDATQSGVVMTAYAFGRPVVASAVGGLPEYVLNGTTGLIVPPRSAHALAEAVIRVLSDPELRGHMKRGVDRACTTHFNWNRAAAETLEVYARARATPILRSPHS